MSVKEFDAEVMSKGPGGAWAYIPMPFDVPTEFGVKGVCAVKGTVNGFAFRTSLMPATGGGEIHLMFNKEMKAGSGATVGEVVHVVMERDREPKIVETAADLAEALAKNPVAQANFDNFAYSHKKEYVDWINSAKQQATRERRVEQAVGMIAEKKRQR